MLKVNIPFYKSEIECRCGCGKAIKNSKLINKLAAARWIAKIEFPILSWNRCLAHNKEVGGVPDSEHLKGLAVDVRAGLSPRRFIILSSALRAGFTRIGIYPWGLHLGADPKKPQNVIWTGGEGDD